MMQIASPESYRRRLLRSIGGNTTTVPDAILDKDINMSTTETHYTFSVITPAFQNVSRKEIFARRPPSKGICRKEGRSLEAKYATQRPEAPFT